MTLLQALLREGLSFEAQNSLDVRCVAFIEIEISYKLLFF